MAEPRRVAFISLSPVRRREAEFPGTEREPEYPREPPAGTAAVPRAGPDGAAGPAGGCPQVGRAAPAAGEAAPSARGQPRRAAHVAAARAPAARAAATAAPAVALAAAPAAGVDFPGRAAAEAAEGDGAPGAGAQRSHRRELRGVQLPGAVAVWRTTEKACLHRRPIQ